MRVTWLPDVLRAAGLPVYELPGWRGRGRPLSTVRGLVAHDTVTTRSWTDARVDALLRDGRPSVPGPLAQCGMDRTGRWRIIADGRCNHNGYGTWGNNSIGVEVYAAGGLRGQEEPWNAAQRESFVRGAVAILARLGMGPATNLLGHKETDPRRKIDPYGVDMGQIRQQVAAGPAGGTEEEDDTMRFDERSDRVKELQHAINRWINLSGGWSGIESLGPLKADGHLGPKTAEACWHALERARLAAPEATRPRSLYLDHNNPSSVAVGYITAAITDRQRRAA